MQLYFHIGVVLILSQLFMVWVFWKNFKYALSDPWSHRKNYNPKVLLTIPCKGIDLAFDENIASFLKQDYPDFVINFVVESQEDQAFSRLNYLKEKYTDNCKSQQVNVLVAGITSNCSQKIHNLLYSYNKCPGDVEVLAFADSDACVHSNWLSDIVCPLNQNKTGVTTGYRWFVPEKSNLATLSLSVVNAKIAQFLGKYPFNQVWGGSMAITKENFERFNIPIIWPDVLSDDLSLSYAVKKARKKVVFVPSCIVASYEETDWSRLFEFARRQFLITRVFMFRTWLFALFSSLYSVAGLWGSLAAAIYATSKGLPNLWLYISVPLVFWFAHFAKAYFRMVIVKRLLPEDWSKMKPTVIVDFIASPAYTVLVLCFVISSSLGRVIVWRGVKYKLVSPEKTTILSRLG